MTKVIIEFDKYEDKEDLEDALNGTKYKIQLDDLWSSLFRPRHKHGYSSKRVNELLESEECNELMDELEKLYNEIVK